MTSSEPQPERRTTGGAAWVPRTTVPQTLTSAGFRVRGFGALPDGFDPSAATPRQLAAYRLPRRPDGDAELCDLWERTMARTTRWVTPDFEHREHVSHGPPHRMRGRGGEATNWSGTVDFALPEMPYTYVGGQWTVPSHDTAEDGSYYASEWVGLDGWRTDNVLQAGTGTHILQLAFFRETKVYTWWEWWPAGEVAIRNLPVAPGEEMYCLICVDSSGRATVTISNLSQGVGTRFDVTPPEDRQLVGSVAEWIEERPSVGGSASDPADVTASFEECIAGDCTLAEELEAVVDWREAG